MTIVHLPNRVWNVIARAFSEHMVGRELHFDDVIIRPEEDRPR